jgi:hypothetical protein
MVIMVDYREVIEHLYQCRRTMSGRNWILYISELECNVNNEKYVELQPYIDILKLKRFLVNNSKKLISHKTIRKLIESSMRQYDENYFGNIGNIIEIIETLVECQYCDGEVLLEELKRIFLG